MARSSSSKLLVAVITGQHTFDVPGFHRLFRSMPDLDVYPQDLDNFCADAGRVRDRYDVLLFYNFHQETPEAGSRRLSALETLGKTEQGILVMHHALLAFPDWPVWSDICGIDRRREFGYSDDETVRVHVADDEHPISRGLVAWEMVDETYAMPDAGGESTILLTTDHPESMRTLAWTRQYGRARVFCLESGHDNRAYSHHMFRTVVARGIRWLAGRI